MKLALTARHLRDDLEHVVLVEKEDRIAILLDRMKEEIAEDPAKDWLYAIRPATDQDVKDAIR